MVSSEVAQYFTAVLAVLGFALGLYSILWQILKDGVQLRIRIVPGKRANLDGSRFRCPWLEVTNQGSNPVWVDGIGIRRKAGASEYLPNAFDQQDNPPPWLVYPSRMLTLPVPLMPGELREVAPVARTIWVSTEGGKVFRTSAKGLLGFVDDDKDRIPGPARPRSAPMED